MTTWNCDPAGNVLSVVRPDTGMTTNSYDNLNRVLSTTNPNFETVEFAYGGVAFGDGTLGDNLVRLKDGRGKFTHFTYDLRGQRVRKTYERGQSLLLTHGRKTHRRKGSGDNS